MIRKKETITLSIPPGTREKLEAIAQELDIRWGQKPSISGLLVAIAENSPQIKKLFTLTSDQQTALDKSIKAFIDTGDMNEATILVNLLLNQGQLELPQRQSLEKLIQNPLQAWRQKVEQYQLECQPFQITYRNPQQETLIYQANYSEIKSFEKRTYLYIWCEEIKDIKNPDFPELVHNRCLRFDRILDIQSTKGTWRHEGLDFIEVYLHFYRGLVRSYESKKDDISCEDIGEIKQVIRKMISDFWLVREILPYGKDCQVVAPDSVRELIKKEVRSLCQSYDIQIRL
ncbi:MAG: transcriptional regulator [Microcoleaceae cyanobacterium]